MPVRKDIVTLGSFVLCAMLNCLSHWFPLPYSANTDIAKVYRLQINIRSEFLYSLATHSNSLRQIYQKMQDMQESKTI